MGNQLLITPLIQEVSKLFPNATIDLFVKGNIAPILFKNYPNINQIIKLPKKHFSHLIQYFSAWITLKSKRYDLVINAVANSSSGNLATKLSNSKYKYFGNLDNENPLASKHHDYLHIAKHSVYGLRNYLLKSNDSIDNPIPWLDIKLSLAEIASGKKALNEIVTAHDKVVSLYTYATGNKLYSSEW